MFMCMKRTLSIWLSNICTICAVSAMLAAILGMPHFVVGFIFIIGVISGVAGVLLSDDPRKVSKRA